MTTGYRELINVNKVPPAQHSGGSLGGDITGAGVNIWFLGAFSLFKFEFSLKFMKDIIFSIEGTGIEGIPLYTPKVSVQIE